MKRPLFLVLGWTAFGLGLVGVVLPVLPTTPLMLVALWAFARSSPRFHAWLSGHPTFGPPLQRWQRHRVIPLHAKLLAVVMMTGSFVYLAGFSGAPVVGVAAAGLVMAGAAAYVLTRPSRVPEAVSADA